MSTGSAFLFHGSAPYLPHCQKKDKAKILTHVVSAVLRGTVLVSVRGSHKVSCCCCSFFVSVVVVFAVVDVAFAVVLLLPSM